MIKAVSFVWDGFFVRLILKKNINFDHKIIRMGLVYADIELINADDLAMVRRYKIGEEEVKRMTVKMMVDTGSVYMCINETVQEQLGLAILEKRKGQLADGSIV